MNIHTRRQAVLLAVAALLTIGVGPAAAQPLAFVDEYRIDGQRTADIGLSPPPCDDKAYRLLGAKWTSAYRWSFRAASTPSSLSRSTVKAILRRSFSNITDANNDCGRADRVSATHEFLGKTSRRPNCSARDGRNVVGFGRLPYGVLAVTCFWKRDGRMLEADIKINSRESWATSLVGCRNKPMLEGTMTHEAGHVFGLDHVGERRHGRLTMSPYLDGPCNNDEATLGLGDMRGLEALY